MKFIQILFSTPMVQAINEDRKTMTRRVVKHQPPNDFEYLGTDTDRASGEPIFYACWEGDKYHNVKCPYGRVGDVLWVRETFRSIEQETGGERYEYKATEKINLSDKWKPSLFMPKAACRTFLQIINIRVERLQDISHQDAIAEGVERQVPNKFKNYLGKNYCEGIKLNFPTESFQTLWQSINGKDSWEANPFVWVVEFKRIEKPENFI